MKVILPKFPVYSLVDDHFTRAPKQATPRYPVIHHPLRIMHTILLDQERTIIGEKEKNLQEFIYLATNSRYADQTKELIR